MTESVSRRKAAFTGVLCLINANYIRGGVYASGQDAWIAAAASTLLLLPVAGWFTWLVRRYPDNRLPVGPSFSKQIAVLTYQK